MAPRPSAPRPLLRRRSRPPHPWSRPSGLPPVRAWWRSASRSACSPPPASPRWGADAWSTTAALAFATTVAWVAADPGAVAAEVAAGSLACTVVLIGADGTVVAVVPLVTGVVAAAELAAAAGRVGMVVRTATPCPTCGGRGWPRRSPS